MKRNGLSTDAAVYRKAAKLIEDCREELSCRAIANAAYGSHWTKSQWNRVVHPYSDTFAATEDYARDGNWLDHVLNCSEQQDWRVLALCFMAVMVEAGDA